MIRSVARTVAGMTCFAFWIPSSWAGGVAVDCQMVRDNLRCCRSWVARARSGAFVAADAYHDVTERLAQAQRLDGLACTAFGDQFCHPAYGDPECGPCEGAVDAGAGAPLPRDAGKATLDKASAWATALPALDPGNKAFAELADTLMAEVQRAERTRGTLSGGVCLGAVGDAPSSAALGPPEEGSAFLLWNLGGGFGGHLEEPLARCERQSALDAFQDELQRLETLPELATLTLARPTTVRRVAGKGTGHIVIAGASAGEGGHLPAGVHAVAFVTAAGRVGTVKVERRLTGSSETYRLSAGAGEEREELELSVEAAP
jgi:hypothetical protein